MNLNLGCGGNELGHISLESLNTIHVDLNRDAYWKNVRGDAHHLPFTDKVFHLSYCSHVLEHVDNPLIVLQELKRVTRETVIIKVPNASFYKNLKCNETHIYSWNEYTFYNILKRVFSGVTIKNTRLIRNKRRYLKKLINYALVTFLESNELFAICKL